MANATQRPGDLGGEEPTGQRHSPELNDINNDTGAASRVSYVVTTLLICLVVHSKCFITRHQSVFLDRISSLLLNNSLIALH